MELSGTATVILGMLAARPRSGYDIKQLVDKSTRFFWAASYGQIYPELKRLQQAGLVKGKDASQGNRQRTVYELTAKGRRALREWFEKPTEILEMRDEGLLKLFFAGVVEGGRAPEVIRERGARSAEIAAQLREIEALLEAQSGADSTYIPDAPYAVLRFGIEMNEWVAQWCESAAADLEKDGVPAAAAAGGRS
jgi:DNA-binding PadR family transcriptional regulator